MMFEPGLGNTTILQCSKHQAKNIKASDSNYVFLSLGRTMASHLMEQLDGVKVGMIVGSWLVIHWLCHKR